MISRRKFLLSSGAASFAVGTGLLQNSLAQAVEAGGHGNHVPPGEPVQTLPSMEPVQTMQHGEAVPTTMPTDAKVQIDPLSTKAYTPVTTPNGTTLPWLMKDGVKEFHLIAEPVEREFAPGMKVKCWGYNGQTPGPTIEAVEGDRVRFLVTNKLPEHTTIHWHGILLPSGMDGVGGLSQPHIQPGETYVYEFTLRQHGTHMYHPHADEMTQMAVGMMGLFIIHPLLAEDPLIARDFAILLHNWAVHPGTYRPDPSIMTDFNMWTFNSKVFPAIDHLVVALGQRIRIRIGNLSMHEHPIHLHGHRFWVTGGDGGRWPSQQWRTEVTEIVGVGQMRDLEFIADNPGDWALHCHKSHHTMNAMGHGIPNTLGVDQRDVQQKIRALLPGYVAMGESGMAEHAEHLGMAGGMSGMAQGSMKGMNHGAMKGMEGMEGMEHGDMQGMKDMKQGDMKDMAGMNGMAGMDHGGGLPGPRNTLPMMGGTGPFGPLEMGGMFTVLKVREGITRYDDPGWYQHPAGTVAYRLGARPAPANEHSGHNPG